MYHKPQTKQRGALAAALCAIAVLIAGAASAAETAARITAVEGGTHVGDAAADRSAALGEDAAVQTADDGNCALLVDEDALVELCSSTIMTLTRRPDTGNRVVKVDAGTTRVVAEPRSADEYIEIHTPAAIATIMGTIVFVEVDPVTGATKITPDNPVKVESSDPNVTGSSIASEHGAGHDPAGRGAVAAEAAQAHGAGEPRRLPGELPRRWRSPTIAALRASTPRTAWPRATGSR